MTSQQILQSDFLDILFEKRNKMYGAYFLRRHYNEHLLKALGITLSFIILLLGFAGSSDTRSSNIIQAPPIYNVSPIDIPPNEKPEAPKPKVEPAPQQVVKQVTFTNYLNIVETQNNPIAPQNSMDGAIMGNQTIDGSPATGIPQPPTEPSTGSGTIQEKVEEPPVKEVLPSRQPQFPGGSQAWLNFLNLHLRAPQDLEPGEKRIVVIRFSVDEEGTITNFHVAQSGGNFFDQEVIRVLKKMPKWLPAIQNGRPVAVSFTQPVTFFGQEE